jgi:two-component system, LytTR family, sensor kinase
MTFSFIHTFCLPDGTPQRFNFMYLPLYIMKQNKLTPAIAHAAGWIFFFSLVLGFLYNSRNAPGISTIIFSWSFVLFCIIYLFLFYFNTYSLIPKLYLEKKYVLYFIIVLLLFIAVYFLRPFDSLMDHFRGQENGPMRAPPPDGNGPGPGRGGPPPGEQGSQRTDIVSIVLFITVWSLSTAICIIRQWRITEKRAMQAEADKANAELSFLKAQINPHFLFNTLNNIYSLAVTKNENTAESIMKLSNIMRYVTDDIREDFVSLKNEIECMGDYIDLQRLRLGKKMNVEFLVNGITENKKIAPLILMTFIENVFKYGISNHEPSAISIKISADEHNITFFCQNKLFETKRNVERTGIGIANTRERLKHLYPDKHFLDIKTGNGFFTVQLTLQA